jgi:hypothetical protein
MLSFKWGIPDYTPNAYHVTWGSYVLKYIKYVTKSVSTFFSLLSQESELSCVRGIDFKDNITYQCNYLKAKCKFKTKNSNVSTSRSFPHSWFITGFVSWVTRWMPLVEHERLSLPWHLNSPRGHRITQSIVSLVVFCKSLFVLLSSNNCIDMWCCPLSEVSQITLRTHIMLREVVMYWNILNMWPRVYPHSFLY